jgi:cyanate permease
MPGFVVTGRLFDATGNYQLCLLLFAGIIALATLLLLPLKLSEPEMHAETSA